MTLQEVTGAVLTACGKKVRQLTLVPVQNAVQRRYYAQKYKDVEDPYGEWIVSLPLGGSNEDRLRTQMETAIYMGWIVLAPSHYAEAAERARQKVLEKKPFAAVHYEGVERKPHGTREPVFANPEKEREKLGFLPSTGPAYIKNDVVRLTPAEQSALAMARVLKLKIPKDLEEREKAPYWLKEPEFKTAV